MIVGDGRPLRFLALVSGGWVLLRVGLVWQATGSLPQAVRGILPIPQTAIAATTTPATPAIRQLALPTPRPARGGAIVMLAGVAAGRATPPVDPIRVQLALLALTRVSGDVAYDAPAQVGTGEAARVSSPPLTGTATASRLSVSSWMIARGGTGIGATALSPQLGGTQGGIRIDYALGHGIAATGRVAAPAAGAGRELSLGIAWKPRGVPLRFVAEQRLALDGGRGGPALGVSGGVSAFPLPADFKLEGYGQAGAILRDGVERYVDGSMRAARPVVGVGGVTLDVGGGVWGGAQRGVARLDLGPSVGMQLSLAGRPVRVALDWRQRVAGNARPGSGPALTLGTDF